MKCIGQLTAAFVSYTLVMEMVLLYLQRVSKHRSLLNSSRTTLLHYNVLITIKQI